MDVLRAFVADAVAMGDATNGYHNRNFVLPLTEPVADVLGAVPGARVTVRLRRHDVLPVVIRTWREEPRILEAVRGVLPDVPKCLCAAPDFAIHSYAEGIPLSSICAYGKPVDSLLVRALADILARTTRVAPHALPPLPAVWPRGHSDSQGFLRTLAYLADRQIRRPNWSGFGGLFAALGIPEDALVRLAERVPAMAMRPYSLLHADLHRDNVIISYDGEPPLICVDWELASYGDPLHDLAIHLVRMDYPPHQWAEVVEEWGHAMQGVRPAAVNGVVRDLRHYVAFERAQSVYPDVMRAAKSLEYSTDQQSLDEATACVRRALEAAAEPLRLRTVPDEAEIERILFRRRAALGAGGSPPYSTTAGALDWRWDKRVPERPEFPRAAVDGALVLEGAASAGQVFKGTTHLNTMLRVPGVGIPVVVRRPLGHAGRREGGFLSEHAVLTAIEQSGVAVAAPRVLALGESGPTGRFAVHTYEGPSDPDLGPGHPVNGLLPHEADRLVDQLAQLTRVDYRQVDPAAGEGDFHTWLCNQLVLSVSDLPKETRHLARALGLPDATRLPEFLSRHRVSERAPTLLHADLNPWNLVRREDHFALTLIDWEMALIGDPLYDLVRHMHLTPTRPEIRERMLRRWERLLPFEYTRDGRRDWQVYRWIEIIRSAYVDLDHLVSAKGTESARRAQGSYAMTLMAAQGLLGGPSRPTVNPYLMRLLA
ncbi:aminoglycoside phosphotransferase family protein [Streptomyces sp. NBC_01613]